MTLEAALTTYLLADPLIVAVVLDRISPVDVFQGQTTPRLVYQRISAPRMYVTNGPAGIATVRMQLTSQATTAIAAQSLAKLVRDRLSGLRGNMAGLYVHHCFLEDERWDIDVNPGTDAHTVRIVQQDFEFMHAEA